MCLRVQQRRHLATCQRQFYVKLISPSLFEGWMAGGSEVPPPPPAYVMLVPAGWEVEGRRYTSLRVERLLAARAVYRATPAVSSPLGNGTAVEVEVAAEEVVWPQQPAAEVRRLYYVAVEKPGYVEGGPGYYPAGSVVRIEVKMPKAPPGCRYVFAGWVGLDATGSEADGEAYICIAAARYAGVPRHEVRLSCRRARVG